jgi:hypothetical protein
MTGRTFRTNGRPDEALNPAFLGRTVGVEPPGLGLDFKSGALQCGYVGGLYREVRGIEKPFRASDGAVRSAFSDIPGRTAWSRIAAFSDVVLLVAEENPPLAAVRYRSSMKPAQGRLEENFF